MAQEPPGLPPEPPPIDPWGKAPPGSGRGIPWERREELGVASAFLETTREVLTGPTDFFRRMPVTGGIGGPLAYGVLVGYLGILVTSFYNAIFLLGGGGHGAGGFGPLGDRPELARFLEAFSGWGGIIGQVIFGPIGIVIGLFVWTAILHVILLLLDGAGQGFEATFRALAFAQAPNVFAIVPLCGSAVAGVYGLVLTVIGLSEAQRIPVWKAVVAVLLPLFLCCCCCAAFVATMVGGLASLLPLGSTR
jgi:hypothetical protein